MRNNEEKVIALDLPPAKLDEPMQAYFAKCQEKLGFIPNVLKAYEFDLAKLKAFVAMSDDLMLAPSGLSKLEREMIAVAVSIRQSLPLLPGRAWRRGAKTFR